MRKKLFTLLVALLVLGIQAKAEAVVVGIQAGDSLPAAGSMNNERGAYAGIVTSTLYKLTFEGGKFVYKKGAPDTKFGSDDRISVNNPAVNFITFKTESGGDSLTLSYNGINYSRFVVFQASDPNSHVNSYPDTLGTKTTDAWYSDAIITPQDFSQGSFQGFLAIQAGGVVDDPNLLIVVHNKAGALSLMSYKEYVKSMYPTSTTFDLERKANQYFPLFIKTQLRAGRWATPADFVGCKFWQFHSRGEETDGKVLTAYSAADVEQEKTSTPYSTFTVKQVDYVDDSPVNSGAAGPAGGGAFTNNIISHVYNGTVNNFQGLNWDFGPTQWCGNEFYGTTTGVTGGVIPLFVLATPENDCKVLSVSRINRMQQESRINGGYADRLEIRDYAHYYSWVKQANNTYKYTENIATPTTGVQGDAEDAFYDTYTSLQKFAIWIDDDGQMTLYPAASYFWQYGEYKGGERNYLEGGQPDDIRANAVLVYNDIRVAYNVTGVTPINQADKLNGLQIGWWNGLRSTDEKASAQFTTMGNIKQTLSDYSLCPFEAICWEDNKYIDQRFYFMQVYPDTVGAWAESSLNNVPAVPASNPFRRNGYQWQREYVLSTQVWQSAPSGAAKFLAVVPKEVQRLTDPVDGKYWRFAYDSVNMAAHWEAIAVDANGEWSKKSGLPAIAYRFINMLGDTLKFDPTGGAVYPNGLTGGYTAVNRLIPGADGGIAADVPGVNYFGRPEIEGTDPLNWFAETANLNTADTRDMWTIHRMKGSDAFFLEMYDHSIPDSEVTLTIEMAAGVWNGWYNGTETCIEADNGITYYQQNVIPGVSNNVVMESYISGDEFDACPGLKITLEEIYYVPKVGPFYDGEPVNAIINTNDPYFLKQDSLTAYSFLTGFYHIKEATDVENTLKLGYENVPIFDGVTTVNAARLKLTDEKLEFIPLNSATGALREAGMRELWDNEFGTPFADDLGILYGETYKWYIVKAGSKYLSFDWVNMSTRVNREAMGMIFTDELENAVPVRLYQPLVGDKANKNFLFQFYIPNYKYYRDEIVEVVSTNFYEVESSIYGTPKASDEVCFATLSNESDFLFATRVYAPLTSGTRFTFDFQEGTPCECLGEFIYPQWLGAARLLNLPLNQQLWENKKPLDAWIAVGDDDAAIIVLSDEKEKSTTLKHTYVATIKEYPTGPYAMADVHKVAIPFGTARNDTTWIGNVTTALANPGFNTFQQDLDVDLYNIQNAEGLYLTVIADNDMSDPKATTRDVNGVKLGWREKYNDSRTDINTLWGYDRRALQLFAISGCTDPQPDANKWYGEFVYLPLASYVYDYANLEFEQNAFDVDAVYYNFHLGKEMTQGDCPGNDLRDCWRVAQYTWVGGTVKNLVVFNAHNSPVGGSLIPIQVKLSKQDYLEPDCEYYLVKNIGRKATYGGNYYTFDDLAIDANEYSLFAHWQIIPDAADEKLFTFVPELEDIYGVKVGSTAIPQTQLKGEYYFVEEVKVGTQTGYLTIDVSGYATNNFEPKLDTLLLSCTEHAVPFFDLEADGGFDLMNKLAILETPFLDRNITYEIDGEMLPIWRGGQLIGYQTRIKNIGGDFEDAEYLTVYKENRRQLSDERHVIPYYSFSITKKESNVDVEYFMNVDVATSTAREDSVYWTKLSDADRLKLIDWVSNPSFLPTYKFCLPYQVKPNGERVDKVKYADGEYHPVYIQTLDLGETDYPYLIIAGSATKYVTTRNLWDAIYPIYRPTTLKHNIYTVDYRYIDPVKVTAWIFGGQQQPDNVWVPLLANGTAASVEGVLTDQGLQGGGITFLTESKEDPNRGILTGIGNAPTLSFDYLGETVIGTYAVRPIWYYRISLGEDNFLTDATGDATVARFPFNGETYAIAHFTEEIPLEPTYTVVPADKGFVQAFGFKYVDSSEDVQSFYVVSNANYNNKPAKENEYRYLSNVGNHLVFVEDQSDALIFQYGHIEDGEYTDLKVVGKAGIFGVDGGIKFLDTTGKVDIYSIDGRLIKSAILTGGEQVIAVPRGIAVVKSGSNVVKVAVQ